MVVQDQERDREGRGMSVSFVDSIGRRSVSPTMPSPPPLPLYVTSPGGVMVPSVKQEQPVVTTWASDLPSHPPLQPPHVRNVRQVQQQQGQGQVPGGLDRVSAPMGGIRVCDVTVGSGGGDVSYIHAIDGDSVGDGEGEGEGDGDDHEHEHELPGSFGGGDGEDEDPLAALRRGLASGLDALRHAESDATGRGSDGHGTAIPTAIPTSNEAFTTLDDLASGFPSAEGDGPTDSSLDMSLLAMQQPLPISPKSDTTGGSGGRRGTNAAKSRLEGSIWASTRPFYIGSSGPSTATGGYNSVGGSGSVRKPRSVSRHDDGARGRQRRSASLNPHARRVDVSSSGGGGGEVTTPNTHSFGGSGSGSGGVTPGTLRMSVGVHTELAQLRGVNNDLATEVRRLKTELSEARKAKLKAQQAASKGDIYSSVMDSTIAGLKGDMDRIATERNELVKQNKQLRVSLSTEKLSHTSERHRARQLEAACNKYKSALAERGSEKKTIRSLRQGLKDSRVTQGAAEMSYTVFKQEAAGQVEDCLRESQEREEENRELKRTIDMLSARLDAVQLKNEALRGASRGSSAATSNGVSRMTMSASRGGGAVAATATATATSTEMAAGAPRPPPTSSSSAASGSIPSGKNLARSSIGMHTREGTARGRGRGRGRLPVNIIPASSLSASRSSGIRGVGDRDRDRDRDGDGDATPRRRVGRSGVGATGNAMAVLAGMLGQDA